MSLSNGHLLGMRYESREDIEEILRTAVFMKQIVQSANKKAPHLAGRSIITMFYENSTRTRMSFELAAKYMSAAAANISASASSVAKGESLIDTGRTLDQMGTDIIIMRHPCSGAPHLLSRHVKASVINAGDGTNEHPTQALLDMFTMREKKGRIKGLRVAIVGDVLHSRVARSNVMGLCSMGASVTLCAPETLCSPGFDEMGASVTTRLKEAVKGADVVMALRIQRERQKGGLIPSVPEYHRFYGVTQEALALADDALIMHPGPMNRGVEISSLVADAPNSAIDEQVMNGVAVRMAILYLYSRRQTV